MNLRLALYELAQEHRLDAAGTRRLHELAGLEAEPPALSHGLTRGVAVLAAALGGLGVVIWIAANWDDIGRAGRFALLMAFTAVMGAGAMWRPAARASLGLLAFLGMGGLFAYFGQTYQTGADPWQLFALWAALGIPLCLGVRSDVLWAPWSLVAMVAISLWAHAHLGHRWAVHPEDIWVHALAGLAAVMLTVLLSRAFQAATGAGLWSLRTAVTLTVAMVTFTALSGLFHKLVAPHYGLGLALLTAGAVALARRGTFDVFALSAVALGLNALLVAGLARLLLMDNRGAEGALLLLGLVAAGLLAASVSGILRLSARHAVQGDTHG